MYKLVPENMMPWWQWAAQVQQYPEIGEPGMSYSVESFSDDFPGCVADCLVYRNEQGRAVAVLNHYPQDVGPEKKGNICFFVDPKMQGKGLGKMMVLEAMKRFDIKLENQEWTPSGFRVLRSILKDIT